MGIKTKVSIDSKKIKDTVNESIKKAQKKLDVQVLNDCNFYCPLVSSELQKSGINNSVAGSGRLIWQTDYARKQYYGLHFDHSKSDNPNATAKWCESAKAKKLYKWWELVQNEIKHS